MSHNIILELKLTTSVNVAGFALRGLSDTGLPGAVVVAKSASRFYPAAATFVTFSPIFPARPEWTLEFYKVKPANLTDFIVRPFRITFLNLFHSEHSLFYKKILDFSVI